MEAVAGISAGGRAAIRLRPIDKFSEFSRPRIPNSPPRILPPGSRTRPCMGKSKSPPSRRERGRGGATA